MTPTHFTLVRAGAGLIHIAGWTGLIIFDWRVALCVLAIDFGTKLVVKTKEREEIQEDSARRESRRRVPGIPC